jgi:fatty acid desaturase
MPTITVNDPAYSEKRELSAFDAFFTQFINDKRDLPFIYLSLKITLLIVPFALFLFLHPQSHWSLYLIYLVLVMALFLGPYILMLHNTCHRKLFKKQYAYLTKYVHWFLGGFFGQTPETYFHHHIAMHHIENNLLEDLSSTMKYKRDSIRGFLRYLLSFYFFGIFNLTFYFSRKNRSLFAWKVVLGECIYIALVVLLCFYNFKATLVVYLLPLVFTRFAMMSGNWAQHAFIDPLEPGNLYKNSITCINTAYNKKCFNDGYHIGHHLRPGLHWTEMPDNFMQNIEKYQQHGAIVFSGLDYFQIWFLLMTKNYRHLSKKFVSLSDNSPSQQDIIQLLKNRTKALTVVS